MSELKKTEGEEVVAGRNNLKRPRELMRQLDPEMMSTYHRKRFYSWVCIEEAKLDIAREHYRRARERTIERDQAERALWESENLKFERICDEMVVL